MRREHPNNYGQDNSFGGDVVAACTTWRWAGCVQRCSFCSALFSRPANRLRESHDDVARARDARANAKWPFASRSARVRCDCSNRVLTESVLLCADRRGCGRSSRVVGRGIAERSSARKHVPRLREVNVDLGVLGVTLAIAVGTGMIFGLVPGLASARPELTEALKEGGRSSTQGTARNRLRNGLVIAEVALALVLSIAAPDFCMRKFRALAKRESRFQSAQCSDFRGFRCRRFNIRITRRSFVSTMKRNVESRRFRAFRLPDSALILPLAGTNSDSSFAIEGKHRTIVLEPRRRKPPDVSPDYFRALEIPLIKGRFFTDADKTDAPPVIIVNQAFAKNSGRSGMRSGNGS